MEHQALGSMGYMRVGQAMFSPCSVLMNPGPDEGTRADVRLFWPSRKANIQSAVQYFQAPCSWSSEPSSTGTC